MVNDNDLVNVVESNKIALFAAQTGVNVGKIHQKQGYRSLFIAIVHTENSGAICITMRRATIIDNEH